MLLKMWCGCHLYCPFPEICCAVIRYFFLFPVPVSTLVQWADLLLVPVARPVTQRNNAGAGDNGWRTYKQHILLLGCTYIALNITSDWFSPDPSYSIRGKLVIISCKCDWAQILNNAGADDGDDDDVDDVVVVVVVVLLLLLLQLLLLLMMMVMMILYSIITTQFNNSHITKLWLLPSVFGTFPKNAWAEWLHIWYDDISYLTLNIFRTDSTSFPRWCHICHLLNTTGQIWSSDPSCL